VDSVQFATATERTPSILNNGESASKLIQRRARTGRLNDAAKDFVCPADNMILVHLVTNAICVYISHHRGNEHILRCKRTHSVGEKKRQTAQGVEV
jgi:hypothetical protein